MSNSKSPFLTISILLLTFSTLFYSISCNSNAAITPTLRATPEDFLFTLTFSGGKTPFTSISDFKSNTQIVINSSPAGQTNTAVTFEALALDSDLTIFQIYLLRTEIYHGSVITVSFTDFKSDSTRTNYISGSVSLSVLPALSSLSDKKDLINVVSKVDYVLEIVWTTMTLLNPYWLLYADGKMYREMFDMFKRIDVQHEPFVTTFWRTTDRKISGLRTPNLFGIFILDNDFASEWSLKPQNVIGYGDVDADRITDLRVHVNNSVHEYDSYPLFLDNFGSELTFLVCNLILACVVGSIPYMKCWSQGFKDDSPTMTVKIIRLTSHILWNLLLLGVIGSCQSFSYYTMVQIQAFFSNHTDHNVISFIICVALAVISLGLVVAYVLFATRKIVQDYRGEAKVLRFFDYAMGFYKAQRFFYPLFILLPIVRSVVAGLITLFVLKPVIQTACLLAISVIIIIAMVLIRPFNKIAYTVFVVLYEFITAIFLALLLIIAINDDNGTYDSSTREGLGVALIIFWIIIPILTILFCLYGLFDYWRQSQQAQPARAPQIKITKIFPETHLANEAPQQQQFVVEETQPEPAKNPRFGRFNNQNKVTPVIETPPVASQDATKMKETLTPLEARRQKEALLMQEAQKKKEAQEQQEAKKVKINEVIQVHKLGPGSVENTTRIVGSETDNLLGEKSNMAEKRNESIVLRSGGGHEEHNMLMEGQPRTLNELNHVARSGNGMGGGHRRKFPFEPVELKLLPESHKFIDEEGFKSFVGNN